LKILRDTEESQVKDIERRVWTASTTAGANSKDGKEMINGCRVIEFPEVPGPCGDLTFSIRHQTRVLLV
jgi:hypothetical protein